MAEAVALTEVSTDEMAAWCPVICIACPAPVCEGRDLEGGVEPGRWELIAWQGAMLT